MHSIELGNIVLILVGIALVIVAIVILYRTAKGLVRRKDTEQSKNVALYLASELLNLVIGVVFLIAGVLFVLNNLRGNPIPSANTSSLILHFESQTKS